MALDETWFSEPCDECGSAFSLRIKQKLHEEQTPYQHIEIYETAKFGNLMVIDGFVMLSDRDNFVYHEMMSHPALFCHQAPKKVVIIGGGDCGTLREVLKHRGVEEAWQVEIDERVTRVSEQFFPSLCESNGDPRANFFFGDGIQWMKDADPGSIDVIIVDSTDPIGPAEGLFHMRIIKPMHKAMRAAGFDHSRTLHYFQCSYPSGWWSATLARKGADLDGFREQDVEQRGFETRYYNADMHRAAFAAPEFFKRELAEYL